MTMVAIVPWLLVALALRQAGGNIARDVILSRGRRDWKNMRMGSCENLTVRAASLHVRSGGRESTWRNGHHHRRRRAAK